MPTAAITATTVCVVGLSGFYLWRQRQDQLQQRQQELERLEREAELRRREQLQREEELIEAEKAAAAERALAREKAAAQERARIEELQAQAERDCSPVLSTLQTWLAAASPPGVSGETREALGKAFEEARAMVERSLLSGAPATAAAELLGRAEARLAEVARADKAKVDHERAHEALESAVALQDSMACRAALAEMTRAKEVLYHLEEVVPSDGGLAAEAEAHLPEFEQLERDAARRAAARAALEAAIACKSVAACAEALAEAKDAEVEPCPAMELAAILAEAPAHKLMASELAAQIAAQRLRPEARVLSIEDLIAAEESAAATMGVEQLHHRVAELAAAIVTNQKSLSRQLEERLIAAEDELTDACARRADRTLRHFSEERTLVDQAHRSKITELHRQRKEAAIREGVTRVKEDACASVENFRREARGVIDADIAATREEIHKQLLGLQGHLADLAVIDTHGLSSKHVAAAAARVAGAAATGDSTTLLQEYANATADGFAARLLACVAGETAQRHRRTESAPGLRDVQCSFDGELGNFVAAAFAMPGGEGILNKFVSHAVGCIFSKLYVPGGYLPCAQQPPASGADGKNEEGTPEAVRQNLAALSFAARLIKRGNVRGALEELDTQLTGACRRQAAAWMDEARHAVLVVQATNALQARARCLNAALHS